MKKILAIALALLMMASTVSLVACSKEDPSPVDPDDDEYEYNYGTDSDTAAKDPSDSDNGDDSDRDVDVVGEWIEKTDKIVVAMDRVVLREGPGRSYDSVATLSWNTVLDRTGTNGEWHKVSYEGQECYINADFTTREVNDFKFVEYAAAEQIELHVKGDFKINLRSTPFYPEYEPTDNVVFSGFSATETDADGESLKLIAKSESGNWYKVSFTGTWGSKTYENTICYMSASSAQYVDGLTSTGNSSSGEATRG